MPNYRRSVVPGSTYFFTQVTYKRQPWLCTELARTTLRIALNRVRQSYPFVIDAFVLLPDHLHCIWTLPDGDASYATRWHLIKRFVTQQISKQIALDVPLSASRQKRQEGNLWQRRFWEHLIRDEDDFAQHCDYIHYNPVKHGLCEQATDWQFSSIHRFIQQGIYPHNWGCDEFLRANLEKIPPLE